MNLIDYVDEDGQTLRGIPVVIIADRSDLTTTRGSKTEFLDGDGHRIYATPLIIMDDYRPSSGGTGGGTGAGAGDIYDGGTF